MIVKAAVLRKVNEPYSIEELELAPPKEKEALVRYVYTGYCHSDLSNMPGHVSMALPLVAGHEAAGIVEEVGPGCTKLKKGDPVVACCMVPCGKCKQCIRGRGDLCSGTFDYFVEGMLLDGTSRFRDKNGRMVRHGNFVSGFSTHAVVPEDGLYGMFFTHIDIPRIVHMAMTRDMKLDKLVTNKFKLEDINDVAEKMRSRQILGRWVCALD